MTSSTHHRRLARPPLPAGRDLGRRGVNFALFSEHAERVELCLFDRDGRRELQRIDAARAHRPGLARLPARGAARACSTATACTARTSPSDGHRFNRTSCCSIPYAQRLRRRRCAGTTRIFGYTRRPRRRRPVVRPARQRAAACRSARSSTAFTWGDDRPPDCPGTTRSSTRCTCAASPCTTRRAAGRCAAPTRAWPRAGDRLPEAPRRHRGRAAAGARLRRRPPPASSRACATTGATTRSASSPPSRATRARGKRRASSRRW